jgi:hypothetical protein
MQLLENPYEMRAEMWLEYPFNTDYLVSNLGKVGKRNFGKTIGRFELLKKSGNNYTLITKGIRRSINVDTLLNKTFRYVNIDAFDKENEFWRNIEGYDNYLISNLGRVKNINPVKSFGLNETILKKCVKNHGYEMVTLCSIGVKNKKVLVHRLVADAFLEKKHNGENIVNHINGDKTDNRIENLEWVSHRENITHGKNRNKNIPYGIGIRNGERGDTYNVRIRVKGESQHIGVYKTLGEAVLVRDNYLKNNNIVNKYI